MPALHHDVSTYSSLELVASTSTSESPPTQLFENDSSVEEDATPIMTHPVSLAAATTAEAFSSSLSPRPSSLEQDERDQNTLRFFPLLAILFYTVSGGPYGCEACVRAGGNFYALAGFLVAPLIWSIPEALMTAELGTAIPEASAGVAWVEEAFGNMAGWTFGYLTWISGATDNAIYPVLFLDYLVQAIHSTDDDTQGLPPFLRFCLISGTSMVLAYVNWLGLPLVGNLSVSICVMSMSPFIILCLVGSWKLDPNRWFTMPSGVTSEILDDDDSGPGLFANPSLGGVLWRPYLNNLFWNLNSFDAAGTFAEDIHDPSRLLPKALNWSIIIVAAAYFVPLLIATGASDSEQHDWVDGYLARVASDVVGSWLGAWTVFAAGVSNIALFQAELSADALQLMGMADRGYLPEAFAKRSRHGTPTCGLLLCTAVIVVMGTANLDRLIEMLNFNYGLSVLMEYAAFIKLRITRPDLERPYRIPLNTMGCILFFVPTVTFTTIVLCLASYATFAVSIVVNIIFLGIFYAKQRSNQQAPNESYEKVGSISEDTFDCNPDRESTNETLSNLGNGAAA